MSKSQIAPLLDWMLVKVVKSKGIGKIELPEQYEKDEEVVEVVAIGPDVTKVIVGERIVPVNMSGTAAQIEGVQHVFIRERDVIAKVG